MLTTILLLLAAATATQAQDFVGGFGGGDLDQFLDVFQAHCVPPSKADFACSAAPASCSEPLVQPAQLPSDIDVEMVFPRTYFFNESSQTCQAYPEFSVCPPSTSNYFESVQQCRLACIRQCQQPPPQASGNCAPLGVTLTAFYFDPVSVRCVWTTEWDGCATTENLFETAEECSLTCNPYGTRGGEEINLRSARQAAVEVPTEPVPIDEFCQDFKENVTSPTADTPPDSDVILIPGPTAEQPSAGENESVNNTTSIAPPEHCSHLQCVRYITETRSRLNWVTVYSRTDCIEVVMRINCRKGWFRRPNDTELTRLCGLVKSGIETYWSRDITHECGGQTVVTPVRVRVHLVSRLLGMNAKDAVIKVYNGEPVVGNVRSHNSDLLAMTLKYDYALHREFPQSTVDRFEETAAHEVGHSVLRAALGFEHSWTHKGTSTWYGKRLTNQTTPATGEIDLMKYYVPQSHADWKERTKATAMDVKYLISAAKFSYCTSQACGTTIRNALSHPCYENSDCASGHCQFFRCVACRHDTHCGPDQFCAHQLKVWQPNMCRAKLSVGKVCRKDRQCASGHCHLLRCGECETNSHCPNGTFCAGVNFGPFQANRCQSAKSFGAVCSSDRECASGHCHLLRCSECESDSHCPRGTFCAGVNFGPFQANRCTSAKSFGAVCSSDRECASGHCHLLRCSECESDSHCSSGTFCSGVRFGPFVANRCTTGKSFGSACSTDRECTSGHCHLLRCGECESDSHCPGDQHCAGVNFGFFKANRCARGKDFGSACSSNRECASRRCHSFRCSECGSDGDCPQGQHCAGENFRFFRANRCRAGKPLCSFCLSSRECASTICTVGRCTSCSSDSHCPGTHYCSGLPGSCRSCALKKCSGWCYKDSQCGGNCNWRGRCSC